MVLTYEFPPSFARHPTTPGNPNAAFNSLIRFKHQFCLTRLKVLITQMFDNLTITADQKERLSTEVQIVLTSQGYCTALGIVVSSPFFLQELLHGTFLGFGDPDLGDHVLARIIHSINVSERELAFITDICGHYSTWISLTARSQWVHAYNLITNRLQVVSLRSSDTLFTNIFIVIRGGRLHSRRSAHSG